MRLVSLNSSLLYSMFSPRLRERLHEAGATPGEQAQAIGHPEVLCADRRRWW
jgi:hypothetical protein